jgi:hypothetical protein
MMAAKKKKLSDKAKAYENSLEDRLIKELLDKAQKDSKKKEQGN